MKLIDPGMRLMAATGFASVLAFVMFAILVRAFPSMEFWIPATAILLIWLIAFKWMGRLIWEPLPVSRVAMDGDYLTMFDAEGSVYVRLPNIRSVHAYKTASYMIDTVWVRIWTTHGTLEFSQDYEGFQQAMDELVAMLPGANLNWQKEVLAVPLEENRTLVWSSYAGLKP